MNSHVYLKVDVTFLIVFNMWIFTRDGVRAASVRACLSFSFVCGLWEQICVQENECKFLSKKSFSPSSNASMENFNGNKS